MGNEQKSINSLSWSLYQIRAFYDTDDNYNIEYICEALPAKLIADNAWRIYRVRYSKTTNNLVDKMFAVNDLTWNEDLYDFGLPTNEFRFQAIDAAYVWWLSYDINP